ncbi:flagellar biosynthesis protein FlhA [Pelomonas saccharophila]|uniref:Flagellar biosynthesis protein FlhA n=1 Tax=Roseateles saccharophilus TaxID=304 RepID=A0ABU1YJM5_ROSSA|nr:flagellar biosynthesis protein FlhA [Roseateles saccharophilus]MDR7268226.1 flagellar biosynthesis protein FlhA [Roseateles saccharophilus]
MSSLRRVFGRHADVLLVLMVLGVLTVLFAPIPAALLDFLILANVGFALTLLMLTFYMHRPVEFSTFPSLLLIATLFRLSLNVAATRLILTDASAGQVIGAVGSYVVAGNFVIGLIVFLILVVVQYVVVTNGAQRVSEVAARFTLDSMPGQQMSIDADLNMGFIDQAEAQRRRKTLERQAAFYGAMDGASKFVKGDAVAGIIILLINIVGGLVIGVMQRGMGWSEALQTFTLLTVGDGIVTQIPALVISVGTGIIVTRSASDSDLSDEVLKQLTSFPKAIWLVVGALGVLLLLPGIPAMPVLTVATVLAMLALTAGWRRREGEEPQAEASAEEQSKSDDLIPRVHPVEVRIGSALSALAQGEASVFMQRVAALRKQFAQDFGLLLPAVRFVGEARLQANAYELAIYGVVYGRGELHEGKLLAIHPSGDTKHVKGIETREPTYGLPAVWIAESEREKARAARYTLVDAPTVFITHLSETLRQHCANLVTRAETDRLLNRVRDAQPGLVEELIPTVLGVVDVQKVFQALLREKVSLVHAEGIVETLADAGRSTKDSALLTEAVRQRLGAAICQQLMADGQALHVLTLDPSVEQRLRQGAHDAAPTDPRFIEQVLARAVVLAEQMVRSNLLPVLLCAPDLRRHLRALTERALPHMRVLAVTEVPNLIPLKAFGSLSLPTTESSP